MKLDLKKVAIISLVILVVQMVLTKVYSLFGYSLSQVFAISPQSAIGSATVGNKLVGYLMGILPFNISIPSIVIVYISAFILVAIGMWAWDAMPLWKTKNETGLIFSVLFYGTVILYLVLLVTSWASVSQIGVPLAIGLLINYVILAWCSAKVADYFPVARI